MIERKEILMNQTEQLSMRFMSVDDLKMVFGWCKDEGWNVGQFDAEIYHRAAPKAHMLFLLHDEPIGAISIVEHSKDFFSLGPFIVKKEFRQKGYGAQIWQNALETIEKTATIGLYAVPQQVTRYKKSGFESQFLANRYESRGRTPPQLQSSECQLITQETIPSISGYDQTLFGTSRQTWFEQMLKIPSITGFFLKKDNEIAGFGLLRPCTKGYRIGPLFANSAELAKSLFLKLLDVVGEKELIIDIPASNPFANAFASYFNLTAVPENDTQAMFRNEPPKELLTHLDRNYGIFSLEVG